MYTHEHIYTKPKNEKKGRKEEEGEEEKEESKGNLDLYPFPYLPLLLVL